MRKKWVVSERKYNNLIDQLLYNRGIIGEHSDDTLRDKFLSPDFHRDLHDPLSLSDFEVAVERLKKAKEGGEKIGIFADYDADGVPGAALLYKALTQAGVGVEVFIPEREDGYGLSKKGIDHLAALGCRIIVSVDLGIRNIDEANYCKEIGVDLIITDHHLSGDVLPNALAVVNPKIEGSKYPFTGLAGCGVAYKVVQGLSSVFPEIDEPFLKWNLDLVAISTISDIVPLIDENRMLASYGLLVLKRTRNTGLRALYKAAKIEPDRIDAYSVGFQIGPRINTPGRIDHALKSFELLTTNDEARAEEIATWLNEKNLERQTEMEKIFNEATAQVTDNNLDKNKIIIVSGKWHRGLLGPPASRLADYYHRPVIVFADEEDYCTGSARSVEGVNIVDLLEAVASKIGKFGGHAGAAGLTVTKMGLADFTKAIIEAANERINEAALQQVIKADALVDVRELSRQLCYDLAKLEPFGLANPKPIFALKGVQITFKANICHR